MDKDDFGVDPEIQKLMGFSEFGSTSKNFKSSIKKSSDRPLSLFSDEEETRPKTLLPIPGKGNSNSIRDATAPFLRLPRGPSIPKEIHIGPLSLPPSASDSSDLDESSGTFEPQEGFGTIQAKPKPKPAPQDQFMFKSPSKSTSSESTTFKVPTFKGKVINQRGRNTLGKDAFDSDQDDEADKKSAVNSEDASATISSQFSSAKISSESSTELSITSPVTSNPESTDSSSSKSLKSPNSQMTNLSPISQQHEIESNSTNSQKAAAGADESEDEEEKEEEDSEGAREIPSAHECSLPHGTKPITALALDPAGARLASGGHDFELKVWDFAGMTAAIRPFRTLTPFEKQQVKHVAFSPTGDSLLVIGGGMQARVYDRDGHKQYECVRGFTYISDPAQAKGHTHSLTGGCWNPRNKQEFLTSSIDGTVRIWDMSDDKKFKQCMKPRSREGRKLAPTSVLWGAGRGGALGGLILAGCADGSLQSWDRRASLVNNAHLVRAAHAAGSDVTGVTLSHDEFFVLSRAMDDTMKLWDVRKFKEPIFAFENLVNLSSETDCGFSVDDRLCLTGTAVRPRARERAPDRAELQQAALAARFESASSDSSARNSSTVPRATRGVEAEDDDEKEAGQTHMIGDLQAPDDSGTLCFFDRSTGQLVNRLTVSPTVVHHLLMSVIRCAWHPKLNQIFVALSDGNIKVFFDPKKSHNGILLSALKTKKRVRSDAFVAPFVLTPLSMEKFRLRTALPKSVKSHEAELRKDAARTRKPAVPAGGVYGLGERGATLARYVSQMVYARAPDPGDKDPRASILRYAEKAAADPMWVAPAYQSTQPKALLAETVEEQDEAEQEADDQVPAWKKFKA